MRVFIQILICILLVACSTDKAPKKPKASEQLIEVKHGLYSEWYPGKKQLKFQGSIDKKGNRDGKWVFFSPEGNELSTSVYENGKREGFSVVKYPNGAVHYRGEYRNDVMVGIWTTFDEKGKVLNEKDYGFPNE
jgi:antitoxin component YwqK of YwqJK toxin-antitoxin module